MKYLVTVDADNNIVGVAIAEAEGLEAHEKAKVQQLVASSKKKEPSFGPVIQKDQSVVEIDVSDDYVSRPIADVLTLIEEALQKDRKP